jgi:hypothetical protein
MEWISVKDKLPEFGQEVMCYQTYPKGSMFTAISWPLHCCKYKVVVYGAFGDGFIDCKNNTVKHVSHWMPLPNPPEIKNE